MLKRIIKLVAGFGVASVLPILATPALTRLYTPQEFGVGEIYLICTVLISLLATLRLDAALVIPKEDQRVRQILNAIFTNTLILTFTLIFIVTSAVFILDLQLYYLLLPLSILLVGLYETCMLFNLRSRSYRGMSFSKIVYLGGIAAFKIIFGYLGFSEGGIIIGTIVGQLFGFIYIFHMTSKNKDFTFSLHIGDWKQIVFKDFSEFPKHSLPQAFFNSGREYFVSFIMATFFGTVVLGFYTLALKVMRAPLYLLGNAFSDVAYEHYAKITSLDESIKFKKFITISFATLAIPYFIFFIFFSDISTILFGNDWQGIGDFTLYLSPWFYFTFVGVTFEKLAMVLKRQSTVLKINLLTDFVSIFIFMMVSFSYKNVTYSLVTISFLGSVGRIVMIISVLKMLKSHQTTFKASQG